MRAIKCSRHQYFSFLVRQPVIFLFDEAHERCFVFCPAAIPIACACAGCQQAGKAELRVGFGRNGGEIARVIKLSAFLLLLFELPFLFLQT